MKSSDVFLEYIFWVLQFKKCIRRGCWSALKKNSYLFSIYIKLKYLYKIILCPLKIFSQTISWGGLEYDWTVVLQHVIRLGVCIRCSPTWALIGYTHACTVPRWDSNTCWRRVLLMIGLFTAAVSHAPCARSIANLKTVDMTWPLV